MWTYFSFDFIFFFFSASNEYFWVTDMKWRINRMKSKIRNRFTLFCYESCEDSQTVSVLSLACTVTDFYSFENNDISFVKTAYFRFSQKLRSKSKKSCKCKSFAVEFHITSANFQEKLAINKTFFFLRSKGVKKGTGIRGWTFFFRGRHTPTKGKMPCFDRCRMV